MDWLRDNDYIVSLTNLIDMDNDIEEIIDNNNYLKDDLQSVDSSITDAAFSDTTIDTNSIISCCSSISPNNGADIKIKKSAERSAERDEQTIENDEGLQYVTISEAQTDAVLKIVWGLVEASSSASEDEDDIVLLLTSLSRKRKRRSSRRTKNTRKRKKS